MKAAKRRFNRMVWFKQLIPRTLHSIYREDEKMGEEYFSKGPRYLQIWRQWIGRAYDVVRVPIAD